MQERQHQADDPYQTHDRHRAIDRHQIRDQHEADARRRDLGVKLAWALAAKLLALTLLWFLFFRGNV